MISVTDFGPVWSLQFVSKPSISNSGTYYYTGGQIGPDITPASSYYTITGNKNTATGSYTYRVSLKNKTATAWSDGSTADITGTYSITGYKVKFETGNMNYHNASATFYINNSAATIGSEYELLPTDNVRVVFSWGESLDWDLFVIKDTVISYNDQHAFDTGIQHDMNAWGYRSGWSHARGNGYSYEFTVSGNETITINKSGTVQAYITTSTYEMSGTTMPWIKCYAKYK